MEQNTTNSAPESQTTEPVKTEPQRFASRADAVAHVVAVAESKENEDPKPENTIAQPAAEAKIPETAAAAPDPVTGSVREETTAPEVLAYARQSGLLPEDVTGKSLDEVRSLVQQLDLVLGRRRMHQQQAVQRQADASNPAAQQQGQSQQQPPPATEPPQAVKPKSREIVNKLREANFNPELVDGLETMAAELEETNRINQELQQQLAMTQQTFHQRAQMEQAERQRRDIGNIESAIKKLNLTKQFGEPETRTPEQWEQFKQLVGTGLRTVVDNVVELTGQFPDYNETLVERAYALVFKDQYKKMAMDAAAQKVTKQATRRMGGGAPATAPATKKPFKGDRRDSHAAAASEQISQLWETFKTRRLP